MTRSINAAHSFFLPVTKLSIEQATAIPICSGTPEPIHLHTLLLFFSRHTTSALIDGGKPMRASCSSVFNLRYRAALPLNIIPSSSTSCNCGILPRENFNKDDRSVNNYVNKKQIQMIIFTPHSPVIVKLRLLMDVVSPLNFPHVVP